MFNCAPLFALISRNYFNKTNNLMIKADGLTYLFKVINAFFNA